MPSDHEQNQLDHSLEDKASADEGQLYKHNQIFVSVCFSNVNLNTKLM